MKIVNLRTGEMSKYLTANELAELVGCKPNQRSRMIGWLSSTRWKFEVASTGLPQVARAYYDRKMGISEETKGSRNAETPNLTAFKS